MSSILDYNNSEASPITIPHNAPLVEGELNRANSVDTITQDISELLRHISRILLSYILEGEKSVLTEHSLAFDESKYLKTK